MLRSRTGKRLLLPSAFGKTLTSGAAFSFPACSRFQGNKIPQARAEVSHLNVTQAENQSGSALPTARPPAVMPGGCWGLCSPPGRTHCGYPSTSPVMGIPVHDWEHRAAMWAMGSARLCPRRVCWGSSCWRVIFGVALTSLHRPNWQSPPVFSTEGRAGTSSGFAALAADAPAPCPCSRQGDKGQALGAAAEPWGCPRHSRGAKPARSPMSPPRHRLWRKEAVCGFQHLLGAAVLGQPDVCAQLGRCVPTPLSRSQPLSSCFNPKIGPSVPPEPLLHIGGVGVAAQRSGAFLEGFDWFLYL